MREALLIGAYILLALGSGLVLYGALTDWSPEQPTDYEKRRRR